jgi:hypothetical protein
VRFPREHVAVEVDGALVVPRLQLEPVGGADLVPNLEPLLGAGLPHTDSRLTRVGDHGHGAVVRHGHRLEVDLAAVRGCSLDGTFDVVGHQ